MAGDCRRTCWITSFSARSSFWFEFGSQQREASVVEDGPTRRGVPVGRAEAAHRWVQLEASVVQSFLETCEEGLCCLAGAADPPVRVSLWIPKGIRGHVAQVELSSRWKAAMSTRLTGSLCAPWRHKAQSKGGKGSSCCTLRLLEIFSALNKTKLSLV